MLAAPWRLLSEDLGSLPHPRGPCQARSDSARRLPSEDLGSLPHPRGPCQARSDSADAFRPKTWGVYLILAGLVKPARIRQTPSVRRPGESTSSSRGLVKPARIRQTPSVRRPGSLPHPRGPCQARSDSADAFRPKTWGVYLILAGLVKHEGFLPFERARPIGYGASGPNGYYMYPVLL